MKSFFKYISNIPGWRTNKRIIVFESDDWGSIRMPSKDSFFRLKKKGVPLGLGDSLRYNKYDSLASKEDLEELFNTLSSFKDNRGRYPQFTAVSLVANPDFEAIKDSNFQKYIFEPFTRTLQRYGIEDAISAWELGKRENIFSPQFHGREHLNVPHWMRTLQGENEITHLAFKEGVWGFSWPDFNFQAAFDLYDYKDLETQAEIIKSGLMLFRSLHGESARFFVPPNGPFNNNLQKIAKEGGIQYLSTGKLQREPLGSGRFRRKFHYLGERSGFGLRYITRNCFFEPSSPSKDWVDSCLTDIKIAFKLRKPAIISTHRVNYIGRLHTSNRTNGLEKLKALLQGIQQTWPDALFLTSAQLGDLISKKITIDELA